MKLALVMVHYGSIEQTKSTLISLHDKLGNVKCYLVNNTTVDVSSLTKLLPNLTLINNPTNFGFARSVNQGIKLALKDSCEAILLLNNDLSWTSGTLPQLTRLLSSQSSVAIVTPLLKHKHGYDWGGSVNLWTGLVKHRNWPNPPKTVQLVDHVAGAAMLIKAEAIKKIGYFDERFFMYYEDVDFCLRLKRAGYEIKINPEVLLTHHVSGSSSLASRTLMQWRSHFLFVLKHLGKVIYPTAIFTDLFLYPLYLFTSLLRKN